MKYLLWSLKLIIQLVASFAYFCMMTVLNCGCWACNTGYAIGIVAFGVCVWDRVTEFRRLRKG